MREIKFRAWLKTDLMMYDVYSIEFLNGGIKAQGTGVSIGNGWATELNGFKHDCDVELMQFTGLKDQNGADIYEGDIVESSLGDVFAVEWHGEYCKYVLPRRYGWLTKFKASTFKVVGNIHENNELINWR